MNWVRSLCAHFARAFGDLPWLAMFQGAVGLAIIAYLDPLLIIGGAMLLIGPIRTFRQVIDDARWHIVVADYDAPVRERITVANNDQHAWETAATDAEFSEILSSTDLRLEERRQRWKMSQNTALLQERLTRPRISLRP
ncbi:MAG TPA: hypothetical protein EYQ80_04350 [Candidatus Poseidoniales archaeon]|nr:hypothetical protein [Candidatus Poseidoniales archaeon]